MSRSIGGHTGDGKGKKGHCRFGNSNELELIEKEKEWKIEIIPDGEKTTATLYKRGKAVKSATVKRYKGDEYSIADAADYAVQKLFEKKKKEKKFEVGARVVATKESCGNRRIIGKKGTIIKISGINFYGVEFDDYIGGHNCFYIMDDVCGKSGHCWWLKKDELKLL